MVFRRMYWWYKGSARLEQTSAAVLLWLLSPVPVPFDPIRSPVKVGDDRGKHISSRKKLYLGHTSLYSSKNVVQNKKFSTQVFRTFVDSECLCSESFERFSYHRRIRLEINLATISQTRKQRLFHNASSQCLPKRQISLTVTQS